MQRAASRAAMLGIPRWANHARELERFVRFPRLSFGDIALFLDVGGWRLEVGISRPTPARSRSTCALPACLEFRKPSLPWLPLFPLRILSMRCNSFYQL